MNEEADVVVVGVGIFGSSIAYQSVCRSDLRIALLEKTAGPSEGSTDASSSFLAVIDRDPIEVAMRSVLA